MAATCVLRPLWLMAVPYGMGRVVASWFCHNDVAQCVQLQACIPEHLCSGLVAIALAHISLEIYEAVRGNINPLERVNAFNPCGLIAGSCRWPGDMLLNFGGATLATFQRR